MRRESGRSYFDSEAEIVKSGNQAVGELRLVPTVKVVGTEVTIVHAVLEHVVGGGEHRSGDGEDGLLGTTPALDAQELSPEVAVPLTGGGPRGLDERGLEPGIARARSIGQALAGALVKAGTEAGPGDEMGGGREARHVEADLGEQHAGGGLTDARHGD